MLTLVPRRAFVGTVAAGLPMLAGAAVLAQTTRGPARERQRGARRRDRLFDHLVSQLVRVHNRSRARGLTGEDSRTVAETLRTLTIYAPQIALDEQVRQGVAAAVQRQGREAVLYAEPDMTAMRDELAHLGVAPGSIEFGKFGPPDDTVRRKVLDELLSAGVSPRFIALSTVFDELATARDRFAGRSPGFRRAQYGYSGEECQRLRSQIDYLEAEVAIVCGAAVFFPALAGACGALSVTLGLELAYYYYFC